MTDIFKDCQRQVHTEIMAASRVVTLRPDMTACQRAQIALEALQSAISQLEMLADVMPVNGEVIDVIDRADDRLFMLRTKLKMRRSLVHLTSAMGKAP